MLNPYAMFGAKEIPREEIIRLLGTNEKALKAFEDYYKGNVLPYSVDENELNSRQAADIARKHNAEENMTDVQISAIDEMVRQIVDELLAQTETITVKNNEVFVSGRKALPDSHREVTAEIIAKLPRRLRPQLTGMLCMKDLDVDSYPMLLSFYKQFSEAKDPKEKAFAYNMFRQGLDILDLDPIVYAMLGMNQNSMSHWLPQLANANAKHGFFKIPDTVIAKAPITLLQLTRQEYMGLTETTKLIVNQWASKAFGLKPKTGDYFIKTGTYSSKFDFRNCRVHDPKEINELGEYLLYIQYSANMKASPLCSPCFYGMSTTNEWVVRKYIKDTENNPVIYKGLPLHTEYRFFIDCDTKKVLGCVPYWNPPVMKKRFAEHRDGHDKHDEIVFAAHEDKLMSRYKENVDMLTQKVQDLLNDFSLTGQWSLDIMQNGRTFYLIDMAVAENSFGYDAAVSKELRRPQTENWLPQIPEQIQMP